MKELKCVKCGKLTRHYLSEKTGEYRCMICGAVSKRVSPKIPKEVVFETDEEFINELNKD